MTFCITVALAIIFLAQLGEQIAWLIKTCLKRAR